MGELSKKIGEHGERLVNRFLELIGWEDAQTGISIKCLNPTDHAPKEGKSKTTHGIDLFFSTRSQLQNVTLENVICSVKYTKEKYPNTGANAKFKAHFIDLAQTMECFVNSDFRAENNESYNLTGIKRASDVGVLFWLTNHKESDQDLISKVKNVIIDKSLKFSTIHIVDNSRAAFIYDSIKSVKEQAEGADVFFHYSFSSSNYTDSQLERYGRILPVEYLTSDILPFRIINREKTTFCVTSRDDFSEDGISRLLNFASDVSQDFTESFLFLFPDYDELEHSDIVKKALRLQKGGKSNLSVSVKAFGSDFRNLVNE